MVCLWQIHHNKQFLEISFFFFPRNVLCKWWKVVCLTQGLFNITYAYVFFYHPYLNKSHTHTYPDTKQTYGQIMFNIYIQAQPFIVTLLYLVCLVWVTYQQIPGICSKLIQPSYKLNVFLSWLGWKILPSVLLLLLLLHSSDSERETTAHTPVWINMYATLNNHLYFKYIFLKRFFLWAWVWSITVTGPLSVCKIDNIQAAETVQQCHSNAMF